MSEKPSEDLVHRLGEHGARYVVGTKGHPVAVLLTLKEYEITTSICWMTRQTARTMSLPRVWLRRLLGQPARSDRPFETTCASARRPVPKYRVELLDR